MKPIKSLVGQKFGYLTVNNLIGKDDGGIIWWQCTCDCGTTKKIRANHLKRNDSISCGCKWKEGISNRFWKGVGDLSMSYFCKVKANAEKRGIYCSISIEDAWHQFEKQNGICALSGVKLVLSKQYAKENRDRAVTTTASLDRIDSSKGYVKGNIQWIHKDLQWVKLDRNEEEFDAICDLMIKVVKRRKRK